MEVGVSRDVVRRRSSRLTHQPVVNFYISQPASSTPVPSTAVLYLTDVFGINLTENRL